MYDFVFINPPSPFLEDQLVMPPLGIMTLSAYLKSKGLDVAIHDMSSNGIDYNYNVPVARFSCFTATTPQYPYAKRVMNRMKKNLKYRKTIYVIGGAHASCFKNCFEDGFDVMNIGEGEHTLHYLSRLSSPPPFRTTLIGKPVENLDDIPLPDRKWKGFEKYKYNLKGLSGTTSITSRGCPYNCGFCFNMFGRNVRFMSPEKVLYEAIVLKEMGFEFIQYYDDTFTANKKRAIKIARMLKKINMKFRLFIRANTVDFKLIKTLKDCGCIEVGMGVESGSQKILDNINKQTTVKRCIDVVNMCNEVGLDIKTFLMVGLPGETKETIEDTKKFIIEANPTDFDITIYTPFPNTPIFDLVESNANTDIEFKDNINYNDMFYKSVKGTYTSNVRTSALSYEEIENARDEIESLKLRSRL